MKNRKFEIFSRMQRQYHQLNDWKLSPGKLYIPHIYPENEQKKLSWWDDVGFVINGRRVMVWWQHPRNVYNDEIDTQSWKKLDHIVHDDWLIEGGTTNYMKLGNSRKKIVSYTSRQPSPEQIKNYDDLTVIRKRLTDEGIDFDVKVSCKFEPLSRARGINLVVPMEIHNEHDLTKLADLAKQLILRKTTLETEFQGYVYGREDWLKDQAVLNG
jgi:hypothetical protein